MTPNRSRQKLGKSGHIFFAVPDCISVVLSAAPSYAQQAP